MNYLGTLPLHPAAVQRQLGLRNRRQLRTVADETGIPTDSITPDTLPTLRAWVRDNLWVMEVRA